MESLPPEFDFGIGWSEPDADSARHHDCNDEGADDVRTTGFVSTACERARLAVKTRSSDVLRSPTGRVGVYWKCDVLVLSIWILLAPFIHLLAALVCLGDAGVGSP